MSFWRAAGINYVRYSNIAAQCVRNALKSDLKTEAAKREITSIKFQKWEAGSTKLYIVFG